MFSPPHKHVQISWLALHGDTQGSDKHAASTVDFDVMNGSARVLHLCCHI